MSSPLLPRLMRLLPLALLALAAAAARGSAQQPTASRIAADIATIKRTGAEFSQKYMRGDNQAMADLYDYGTFRTQNSRDGQVGNPGFGKYVIVWRRQTDGRWLMHLDIWNSSPAATP